MYKLVGDISQDLGGNTKLEKTYFCFSTTFLNNLKNE